MGAANPIPLIIEKFLANNPLMRLLELEDVRDIIDPATANRPGAQNLKRPKPQTNPVPTAAVLVHPSTHLRFAHGEHLHVECLYDHCRNNLGNWPTRQLVAPRGAKGFDYHSVKDRAMAEAAEYGLMLWDGKSKGTVNNVLNLSRDHKPVVVYVAPTKEFRTIKSSEDLGDLLARGDSDSVERIINELHLNRVPRRAAG
jgi:hypothetical protein